MVARRAAPVLSRQWEAHGGIDSHDTDFSAIARDTVLTDSYVFATNPHANYDAFPDGAHFVFLEPDHSSGMVVVVNWGAVLRARMAVGKAK